jgi:hypothetical protein
MAPRYRVTLTKAERAELERLSTTGKRAARMVLYARALLLVDAGEFGPSWPTVRVSEAVGMSVRSVEHLKRRFVEEGLQEALERKERETPPREVRFGGDFEARLLALACSKAPEGRERWTIRLLSQALVDLKIVPAVSTMTVCNTLKKMNLSLTSANTGRSRPTRMQAL